MILPTLAVRRLPLAPLALPLAVPLLLAALAATAVAQDGGTDDHTTTPDWVLEQPARANMRWFFGRGMGATSDAADRAAEADVEEIIFNMSYAVARVMFRPENERELSDEARQVLAERQRQTADDMREWAAGQVRVLRRWAATDPIGGETVHFSLAAVEFVAMHEELLRLANERFPDRMSLPMSMGFLLDTSWRMAAPELHREEWLPRLPAFVTERETARTGALDEARSGQAQGDSAGPLDRFVRTAREYSDGTDFELTGTDLSGFARFAFQTEPEPWKRGVTLDTQLIAGVRVPVDPHVSLFGIARATLTSDTGGASFDGGSVGVKWSFLDLGVDLTLVTVNFAVGFPLGAERDLLLNDVVTTIDGWVAVPLPLRIAFGIGGGIGVDDFFRITLRLEMPHLSVDLGDPGLLLFIPGIDMEWRFGFGSGSRSPDRYVFRFTIESAGPYVLMEWRASGQLGRTWSVAVGWRFR